MHPDLLIDIALGSALLLYPLGFIAHAKSSGWSQMAKRYRATKTPWSTFTIGVCVFEIGDAGGRVSRTLNFSSRLTIAKEGLYLSMPWVFRLLHPTLLMPWDALSEAPLTDRLPPNRHKILIRDGSYLVVTDKAYIEMRQYLPHQHNRSRPDWAVGQLF